MDLTYRWTILAVLYTALACCTKGQMKADFVDELDCPFLCTCADYDVNCTSTNSFSFDIPKETQRLFISSSNLDFVPINAFLSLPDITEIHFIGCNITTLRACSFAELENMTMISFEDTNIKQIEGNAFSNLVHISHIRFVGAKIDQILSFSFHGLRAINRLEFFDTNISVIHPYAFLRFEDIEEVGIMDTTIGKLLRDGFSMFTNVELMYFSNIEIQVWHCGALGMATKSGIDFPVSQSRFSCDCTLAWLWTKHSNSTIIFNTSNKCIGTGKALASVTVEQVCPREESRDDGCQPLLPSSPHTCSRSFDSPKFPLEKVTYPSYFSQTPGPGSLGVPVASPNTSLAIIIPVIVVLYRSVFIAVL